MLTPQKIRVAFEYKKPERYQLAYESVVGIMRNTAIPRHKKLQAIGMTGCQLKTMLMLEGLLYTLLSLIFSLLLSLILSPVLGGAVEQMFWFFSYRFTVWPVLLIAPVFVLLGLLIPLLTYRVIARHTIVERLRDGE